MDFYEQKGLEKVKVIERCLEKKIFEKGSPLDSWHLAGNPPTCVACR